MKIELKEITYRYIAIMMCKSMPVEGEKFSDAIENTLASIKGLPAEAKIALKSAYIFSQKVPREEREDLFQELALTLLQARVRDEKLAYAIARCDWRDWWSKYKIRQHYSLDSVIKDEDGNKITFGELLIGETEFELKMDAKLDAERIWDMLPAKLQGIVQQRLLCQMVSPFDADELQRWAGTHAMYLV